MRGLETSSADIARIALRMSFSQLGNHQPRLKDYNMGPSPSCSRSSASFRAVRVDSMEADAEIFTHAERIPRDRHFEWAEASTEVGKAQNNCIIIL